MQESKSLPQEQCDTLLEVLKTRFEQNPNRHEGLEWGKIRARLDASPDKMWSLNEMEATGG